jgi:glycosyltransferase involved in cell wall biosynthesis
MYAPVAVFGYNRPLHLRASIEALLKNPESAETDLFVFIDGPKGHDLPSDAIKKCRDLAQNISGFRTVTIRIQEENLGLANSIRFGVSSVLEKYDSIIVIEDDIVLSPQGLQFLNEGLVRYEQEVQISSIHAYQYPIRADLNECVLLRGADCWGWATWKDRWASTTFDSKKLRNQILEQGLGFEFNLDGSMQYLNVSPKPAYCFPT